MENIQSLYAKYLAFPNIIIDSRSLVANGLFFALKGTKSNGNIYAESALKNGCSYAIIDDANYLPPNDNRYILVNNVLLTLQQLANYHRRNLNKPVIGITGTNGKTTTKELVSAVLKTKFNIWFTQGNYNNHIGVPLTLLSAKKEHDILVVEMGANHPGEIAELCDIAEPNYGLITNVGKAHLEGFGSFEGVIKTKTELYQYLKKTSGLAFIDESDSILFEKIKDQSHLTYTQSSFSKIELIEGAPFLKFAYNKQSYTTQLSGAYNLQNFKAAFAIGKYFDIEDDIILQALIDYSPTNKRSQVIKKENCTLIVDAYNANPTSMMASLENFASLNATPKIIILGDMKELGKYSLYEHQKIVDFIKVNFKGSTNILIGEEFMQTSIPSSIITFHSVSSAIAGIGQIQTKDATILLKGSRSMQLENLIDKI